MACIAHVSQDAIAPGCAKSKGMAVVTGERVLGVYQEREMAMMSRGKTCWQLASAALCQAASASSENATAKRAERTVMVRKPAASTCAAQHLRPVSLTWIRM